MTEVTFHFNVADPVDYAGRLVRRAAGTGVKVVVTGDAAALERLDAALWTASPTDFFPHCHAATAEPHVLRASPVVLAASARGTPHHEVLVNVGGGMPDGFEKFERLNEVVSQQEDDRQQARARWKHYASRGYAIRRYDAVTREMG
ncbi:DNA polymerase III subunit chi [Ramlibacter terrae]|uniref:DNA polymerase III subunit chi n=1 Tax=Ramlibacter terrae TaxID=2732511 RepID=A0ABX6P6B1_9BURK|nr:DNA polymerase III subunit chi [Ramlibacter terrae]